MYPNKQIRIRLCHLGVQYATQAGEQRLNVPLALGYLISGIQAANLLEYCDIKIIPPFESLFGSDTMIIDYLLKDTPHVIGFSCYCWNIERTLFICNKIRTILPDLKIVLGGPEATERAEYLMEKYCCISSIIIGEGEESFAELIQCYLYSDDTNVPKGCINRLTDNSLKYGGNRSPLKNLGFFQSPYEGGFLNAADYGSLNIETVRGCIFHCDYCYYSKNTHGIREIPLERIQREIEIAISSGVRQGYLMDPVFNLKDRVEKVCRAIHKANTNNQISFRTEARAELIDQRVVTFFSLANIQHVEIGLQSVGRKALLSVNRDNSMKKFSYAVRLLQNAGISINVGLIIGLPGDSLQDIEGGLDFIMNLGVTRIHCFLLQVLPGTPLWRNAKRLQIIHDTTPPYYVNSTSTLTQQEILFAYANAIRRVKSYEDHRFITPNLIQN